LLCKKCVNGQCRWYAGLGARLGARLGAGHGLVSTFAAGVGVKRLPQNSFSGGRNVLSADNKVKVGRAGNQNHEAIFGRVGGRHYVAQAEAAEIVA